MIKTLKLNNKQISVLIACISILITLSVCVFQRWYFGSFHHVDIGGYGSLSVDYDISEILWKNSDYDYITGTLSLDGAPVSSYPTSIVFYLDDSDNAYSIPIKLRNDIDLEKEEELEGLWYTQDFMFIDREYLTDAGAATDRSRFYCLIPRYNDLRRTYKIGFLMEKDDTDYLIKTGITYKYPD